MQQQVVQSGVQLAQLVPFIMEEGLERWNNQKRRAHRGQFPLSNHLFTLMTLVQVDLTEQQREHTHITPRDPRNPVANNYAFDRIRTALLELFCAPRSSLDNPSLRPSNQQRTFLVQYYGELEGSTGYWAAEEGAGQEGFVQ